MAALPPDLVKALEPYQSEFKEEALALSLRQGQLEAAKEALRIIGDNKSGISERLTYIRIFGEINEPKAIPALLKIVESNQSSGALQQTALQALQRYDADEVGSRVLNAYPNKLRADPDVREAALALLVTRAGWANQLLNAITQTKKINEEDVPEQIVRRLKLLNDAAIGQTVEKVWPNVRLATSAEKNDRIAQVAQVLKTGPGNLSLGQPIFQSSCGSCHKLFGEGGTLGPDLTGYERGNVNYLLTHIIDPNIDIREGYDYYHVTTTDGRTLVGTIAARRGTTITLQPVGGEAITLTANQIKSLKAQPTSLMPERLLDNLTDQQIRDLFAYIMKGN
jgi:putative heme-binding domain-containing protein